jgi:hypothetical protein
MLITAHDTRTASLAKGKDRIKPNVPDIK